jgi:hypothetical protein
MKKDYKHGRFLIATTKCDPEDWRDAYEEFCEDMGIPGSEAKFIDWAYEEVRMDFEQDLENIKDCREYNVPVVVTGILGLWWGRPEIEATRFESVFDAIEACMKGADEVDVKYDDGEIIVYATHHDGTNVFTINALSKKGVAKKNASYKSYDVKRFNYLYA